MLILPEHRLQLWISEGDGEVVTDFIFVIFY